MPNAGDFAKNKNFVAVQDIMPNVSLWSNPNLILITSFLMYLLLSVLNSSKQK